MHFTEIHSKYPDHNTKCVFPQSFAVDLPKDQTMSYLEPTARKIMVFKYLVCVQIQHPVSHPSRVSIFDKVWRIGPRICFCFATQSRSKARARIPWPEDCEVKASLAIWVSET